MSRAWNLGLTGTKIPKPGLSSFHKFPLVHREECQIVWSELLTLKIHWIGMIRYNRLYNVAKFQNDPRCSKETFQSDWVWSRCDPKHRGNLFLCASLRVSARLCASLCPACRGDSKPQRGALHFHHFHQPIPSAGGSSQRRPCWRNHSHLTKQRRDNVKTTSKLKTQTLRQQTDTKSRYVSQQPKKTSRFWLPDSIPKFVDLGSWHCELPCSDIFSGTKAWELIDHRLFVGKGLNTPHAKTHPEPQIKGKADGKAEE